MVVTKRAHTLKQICVTFLLQPGIKGLNISIISQYSKESTRTFNKVIKKETC